MVDALIALFSAQGGVASSGQILAHMPRRAFEAAVDSGVLERLWQGIYCLGVPDDVLRLRGLDLLCARKVPVCLATAAAVHGFDTEAPGCLHVLSPPETHLRSADGLVVHRRDGAPLIMVAQRLTTAPNWTAVEVARSLRRPRALATLDAALRSGSCDRGGLRHAAREQWGRRGIVQVRELIELADPSAESPMESEARLVMHDGGLPRPELQYEIVDGNRELRRLDFAWPFAQVAAEYDGEAVHSGPEAMRRDRRRLAALQDIGWTVVPMLAEDVRQNPARLVARLFGQLERARAA